MHRKEGPDVGAHARVFLQIPSDKVGGGGAIGQ
jgi:hypothetical protein